MAAEIERALATIGPSQPDSAAGLIVAQTTRTLCFVPFGQTARPHRSALAAHAPSFACDLIHIRLFFNDWREEGCFPTASMAVGPEVPAKRGAILRQPLITPAERNTPSNRSARFATSDALRSSFAINLRTGKTLDRDFARNSCFCRELNE
jgi:hypothetical protein